MKGNSREFRRCLQLIDSINNPIMNRRRVEFGEKTRIGHVIPHPFWSNGNVIIQRHPTHPLPCQCALLVDLGGRIAMTRFYECKALFRYIWLDCQSGHSRVWTTAWVRAKAWVTWLDTFLFVDTQNCELVHSIWVWILFGHSCPRYNTPTSEQLSKWVLSYQCYISTRTTQAWCHQNILSVRTGNTLSNRAPVYTSHVWLSDLLTMVENHSHNNQSTLYVAGADHVCHKHYGTAQEKSRK